MDLMSFSGRVTVEVGMGSLMELADRLIGHNNSSKKEAEDDEFISLKDVMVITQLARQTIYGRVSKGTIPYHKAPDGKKLRFKRSEISEWMTSGKKSTSNDEIGQEV
jgi:excisionase family DNA binding protein